MVPEDTFAGQWVAYLRHVEWASSWQASPGQGGVSLMQASFARTILPTNKVLLADF
jgi:hypothetical protein